MSKYINSQADREDIFQEIFVKIYKALPKFRGDAALGTWIYRITVNEAISFLNRQKRQHWFKQILSGFRQLEVGPPELKEDQSWRKILDHLNARQKMVLLLADVEERPLKEIAELLKLPAGTVKSNLHRAREIVKKELMKNGGR